MASYYDETPGLWSRVRHADLIVTVGKRRLDHVEPDPSSEEPRVIGVFACTVDEVFKGERPQEALLVRTIGEGRPEEPRWTVPLDGDEPLVLFAQRESGRQRETVVLYFASAYRIRDRVVSLPDDVLDERSREALGGERVHLEALQRLVEATEAERVDRQQQRRSIEPEADDRKYPTVHEQPQEQERRALLAAEAEGQPAEVEQAPEQRA